MSESKKKVKDEEVESEEVEATTTASTRGTDHPKKPTNKID